MINDIDYSKYNELFREYIVKLNMDPWQSFDLNLGGQTLGMIGIYESPPGVAASGVGSYIIFPERFLSVL